MITKSPKTTRAQWKIWIFPRQITRKITICTLHYTGCILELARSTAPKQRNPFGESGELCPKSERHPDDLSGRWSLQFIEQSQRECNQTIHCRPEELAVQCQSEKEPPLVLLCIQWLRWQKRMI